MAGNGELVQLPAIIIGWDEVEKVPRINVNWDYFNTYEFVFGVLEAAKRVLENNCRAVQLQKIQQQAQQQLQEAAILQDLQKGRVT